MTGANSLPLKPIESLEELQEKARVYPTFLKLAVVSAMRIGGRVRMGRSKMDDPQNPDYSMALHDAMDVLAQRAREKGHKIVLGFVEEIRIDVVSKSFQKITGRS